MIDTQKAINKDPLLSTQEAAQYLNRDPRTLVNDRCNDNGPKFARLGRLVRYRQSDLDAYIDTSMVGGAS
jgi:excisionase family DNA binding protein